MNQITKKQLQELYNTTKNKDIAKKLGISEPTLLKLIRQAGIKTKGSGNHKINLV